MNKEEIISIVKKYVKNECYDDSTGHDWCHIQRVYNNAMLINKKENADEFIITIIVLMHDLYDATAEAVEAMLPILAEKGYQFVTLSDYLASTETK